MDPNKRRDLERLRDWHAAKLADAGITDLSDADAALAAYIRLGDLLATYYRLTAEIGA